MSKDEIFRHRYELRPKQDEAPGFHKLNLPQTCKDPEHAFPTHLHIPPGMKYVHYCPSCNNKFTAFGVIPT